MINPDDPQEWLAQIQAAPESAPEIVKTLLARLSWLEETNHKLRNTNIELQQKIDTRAHQKEVDELRRQIEAFARLVRARSKHAPGEALIAWSSNGHALAFDLESGELGESSLLAYAFRFPPNVRLHLLTAPLPEEILFLTNRGQGAVFQVNELVRVTQEATRWHKLPGLNLSGDEFLSAAAPLGDFPLCHSLVTCSRDGYVRSILRWSMDRFLQEAQFGKGVKQDRDVQMCAQLCFNPASNIILFTQRGNYLSFAESSLALNLMQGIRLAEGEQVVSMVVDDQSGAEILILDSEGKGVRRSLKSLQAKSVGTKPQAACVAQDVIGARVVSEFDRVVGLMKNGRLAMFDADQAPRANRARELAPLAGITAPLQAFTVAKSF